MPIHEGGCLCGQVRFRAEGEPVNVRLCHCHECQKAFSAPFFARAFFGGDQVTVSGETIGHPTSQRLMRVSCAKCGGRVWTARIDGSGYGLPLAAFDDPEAFMPTAHTWVSEKVPWLRLGDGLPQHEKMP